LNGKECKEIFACYEEAATLLESCSSDHELAVKIAAVLVEIHRLNRPLFRHLKATKNFLPLVDGEQQNPSRDFLDVMSKYHNHFLVEVSASNGFDLKGVDCLMEPWHVIVEHAGDWIDELWEKYDLMIGQPCCTA
jgi:hypothetical protein